MATAVPLNPTPPPERGKSWPLTLVAVTLPLLLFGAGLAVGWMLKTNRNEVPAQVRDRFTIVPTGNGQLARMDNENGEVAVYENGIDVAKLKSFEVAKRYKDGSRVRFGCTWIRDRKIARFVLKEAMEIPPQLAKLTPSVSDAKELVVLKNRSGVILRQFEIPDATGADGSRSYVYGDGAQGYFDCSASEFAAMADAKDVTILADGIPIEEIRPTYVQRADGATVVTLWRRGRLFYFAKLTKLHKAVHARLGQLDRNANGDGRGPPHVLAHLELIDDEGRVARKIDLRIEKFRKVDESDSTGIIVDSFPLSLRGYLENYNSVRLKVVPWKPPPRREG